MLKWNGWTSYQVFLILLKIPGASVFKVLATVQAIRNLACMKPSQIRTNKFEVLRTDVQIRNDEFTVFILNS